MIIQDTQEKYTITRVYERGDRAGECTMQVVNPDGSIDTTKPSIVLNLDAKLLTDKFGPKLDKKEQLKLDDLKDNLEEIRDKFINEEIKEMKAVDQPDSFTPSSIMLHQSGLRNGFDKAMKLLLLDVEKSRAILKLATRFVNEFHHAASSSFAEPMDHDDCKRFAKAFKEIL